MKSTFCLLLFCICNLFFSQDFEWGKLSQEEIILKSVPFEPKTDAVILKDFGTLTLTNEGYELVKHTRIKILSENGYSSANKKWTFNSDDNNDLTTIIKAQTINIEKGKIVITNVENKDIITNKTEKETELSLAFPNVKVGTIIEYKVIILKPYNFLLNPWAFQNDLPTISSKLQLKITAITNYKIILKGKILTEKYARNSHQKYWELENIPSYHIYKHIFNIDDYRENIIFQRNDKDFEPFGKSWKEFKKFLTKDLRNSARDTDFKEIANQITNGKSDLETLKNCLDFIHQNYHSNDRMSSIGENLKTGILKTKTGNSAEFNLLLNGILKEKKITSILAVNSLRYNGKLIVAHPVFSKLQALVNIVTIDNDEKLMIDAIVSNSKNIKYLGKDYFNYLVLNLENKDSDFIIVKPNLSEYISQQELEIENDSLKLNIHDQFKGYFEAESYEKQSIINTPVIKNSESKVKELNDWTVNYKTLILDNPNSSFIIIENPFTEKIKDLTVEKDRDYPVELDFPFLKTIQLKVKIPEGYILNTDNFQETISSFDGRLQYAQNVEYKENNEVVIIWSLLINQIIFQPKEINSYVDFTNNLSNTISKIAVIKKK